MNINDFLSENKYLYLPTKSNPKVALVIDNSSYSKNSFKLYNPFSKKAKLFKSVAYILVTKLNILFNITAKEKKENSSFIKYLEKKLNSKIISSIYFATLKDKVVLQLQTPESKIIGYLKFPLNKIGLVHINNEIEAMDILSKEGIIKAALFVDIYENTSFLLIEELNGQIDLIEKNNLVAILNTFKRNEFYLLNAHPRIKQLKIDLEKNKLDQYLNILTNIENNTILKYKLVYEHGDFTPWNIVKVGNDFIPFDFEYFVKDGLEYLDLIKYFYQVGKLLNQLNNEDLILFIKQEINIQEIEELFKIFLIKEILKNIIENEDYLFDENILNLLEKK